MCVDLQVCVFWVGGGGGVILCVCSKCACVCARCGLCTVLVSMPVCVHLWVYGCLGVCEGGYACGRQLGNLQVRVGLQQLGSVGFPAVAEDHLPACLSPRG